jgi:D-lyxose ketol-isomerase
VNEERKYISKVWGWEDWVVNGAYCGKVLFVKGGKKCSFHYHKLKDETFYLQSGELLVRYVAADTLEKARPVWTNFEAVPFDEASYLRRHHHFQVMKPGDSMRIVPGTRHQFEAIRDSYLFEFSTHHEDSDSIRVIVGD